MALRRRCVPAGLAAAVLLGCASTPSEPTRSVLVGNPAQTLLVLPLNVTLVMPPELEAVAPVVWGELESYLRAHGKKLKTIAFSDARILWLASIRAARRGEKGARAGFDEAAELLVRKLAEHAEFDIVIAPSLFVREATISGRSAAWDGVEREVEFEAFSREARRVAAEAPVEGAAPAASLHVAVLDAEGGLLQEAQGGLELLVRVSVRTRAAGSDPSFDYAPRSDLFTNRENLREGIAQALAPFLAPLPPETGAPDQLP